MKLKQKFLYKLKACPAPAETQKRLSLHDKGAENKKNALNVQCGLSKAQIDAPSLIIRGDFSLWDFLKSKWELHYGHVRFCLMDINCVIYLALIGFLLVFFHKGVTDWPFHVAIHTVFVISILEIIRLGERFPQKKVLWIFRTFYPAVVFLYAWNEMNMLVCMFYGTHWTTESIVRLDKLIFGAHPTVWIQRFYHPWLDELMNIFYSGYYFFMPLVSLTLFIKRKREETLAAFSVVSLACLSNYILFYLFPTLAPTLVQTIQELQPSQYSGYVAAEFTRLVQANGSVRGGAFPSSHVTGALVWSLVALRYQRRLGYVLMSMTLGVAISTVYLGYHHALDPICGFIWGAICFRVAIRLLKRRSEDPLSISESLADKHKKTSIKKKRWSWDYQGG